MKGLGHTYRLPHDALDGMKIVLGLLSGLYYGLKSLLLVSRIQQLHNAVLGKVPTEASWKVGFKSLLKPGAHAHGEISMAGEGPRRTHQLLEIHLNRTGRLIPIAV